MEIPAVSISVDTGSDSGAQSVDTCLEVILDPSKHTPGDWGMVQINRNMGVVSKILVTHSLVS